MKPEIKLLIESCNAVILANQSTLKKCNACADLCGEDTVACATSDACVIAAQDAQEKQHRLLHACNVILDTKKYQTEKQRIALERVKSACHAATKEMQQAISDISFYQAPQACALRQETCNECIEACDEAIEAFEGIN